MSIKSSHIDLDICIFWTSFVVTCEYYVYGQEHVKFGSIYNELYVDCYKNGPKRLSVTCLTVFENI